MFGRNIVTNSFVSQRRRNFKKNGGSMFRRQHTHSMPISSSVKRTIGQSRTGTSSNSARPASIPKKWHAISVDAKAVSCVAAQDLRRKRFLSNEAPALPLEGCTKRATCPCTYRHHDDRRSKSRRESEAGISSNASKHGTERRTSRGRRSDD